MDTPSRGKRRGGLRAKASSSASRVATQTLERTTTPTEEQQEETLASLALEPKGPAAPAIPDALQPEVASLPVIILETALFPQGRLTLSVSRVSAMRAMRAAYAAEKRCLVALYPPTVQTAQARQESQESAEQDIITLMAPPDDTVLGSIETPAPSSAHEQATFQRDSAPAMRSGRAPLAIAQLCPIATLATIRQFEEQGEESLEVVVEGAQRVTLLHWVAETPYLRAAWADAPDSVPSGEHATLERALIRQAHSQFERLAQLSKRYSADEVAAIKGEHSAGRLADRLAAHLPLDAAQQVEALSARDPLVRLESVYTALGAEVETLELENKIRQKVRQQVEKNQREYYLKEQLRAIQEELGADQASEARELREKLEAKGCPPDVTTKLAKEIDRLERMPAHSAELAVLRNYIDWALALPWQERTEDSADMRQARRILDDEQYGLDHVKERIVEFLAVRQMRLRRAQRQAAEAQTAGDESTTGMRPNPNAHRGPILCLIGPPGVGKTSLGRSIAHTLGRKFFRISLGGVHDEAEIRGHRRTYVGALPGRIIQAMKTVGVRNPVIVLDEIDKLASDYRGDPSSALLEALDPEQNQGFTDHYLEVPYDLSEVFFICTGNNRYQIPRALADRMDIIEISGYTEEEKVAIGRTFLLPKALDQCGLAPGQAQISPATMRFVVTRYTREAGVRNLERSLDAICRKIALRLLQKPERDAKPDARVRITEKLAEEYLGAPRYSQDRAFEPGQVGVAMGLAWTNAGGALLPVEVLTMAGKGALMITGQPGEVMQESARAAFSYIRSRAEDLKIPDNFPHGLDIHIHLPEGAVPKEGPSAGITMAIAIISALTKRPVRNDLAMTGEITLRGRVLPIGGLKNKALAAHNVGIRHLLAPAENEKDLVEIPPKIRGELTITLVETMDDVIRVALLPLPDNEATSAADSAEAPDAGKGSDGQPDVHRAPEPIAASGDMPPETKETDIGDEEIPPSSMPEPASQPMGANVGEASAETDTPDAADQSAEAPLPLPSTPSDGAPAQPGV